MNEREWAKEILGKTQGRASAVIELGAHHGHDTKLLFDVAGKPCKYIAVEADPRNIPILKQNIGDRNIKVIPAAIWSSCDRIVLNLSGGNATGSSSVRLPFKHLEYFPQIPFTGKVTIPALSLDSISESFHVGIVDFIWSDIQGAERDMVAGGKQTLARTRWLLTECDRYEMYAGQATRDELLKILGDDWELIAEWPADANLLLKNRKLCETLQ